MRRALRRFAPVYGLRMQPASRSSNGGGWLSGPDLIRGKAGEYGPAALAARPGLAQATPEYEGRVARLGVLHLWELCTPHGSARVQPFLDAFAEVFAEAKAAPGYIAPMPLSRTCPAITGPGFRGIELLPVWWTRCLARCGDPLELHRAEIVGVVADCRKIRCSRTRRRVPDCACGRPCRRCVRFSVKRIRAPWRRCSRRCDEVCRLVRRSCLPVTRIR